MRTELVRVCVPKWYVVCQNAMGSLKPRGKTYIRGKVKTIQKNLSTGKYGNYLLYALNFCVLKLWGLWVYFL